MDLDDECDQLEAAFDRARHQALDFIKDHNAMLPTECPRCREESHIPGLRCANCGYRHETAWAILRDTEYGYEVVSLTDRQCILSAFPVD